MSSSEAWEKYKTDHLSEKQLQAKDFLDEMIRDLLDILEDAFREGYEAGHSDGYHSTSIGQEQKYG